MPVCPLRRTNLVEEMFIDKRNRVVISSRAGYEENSKGLAIYIATKRITSENVIFSDKRMSSRLAGMGITIIIMTPTSSIGIMTFMVIFFFFCSCIK
jgi:hypothetical protein